MAGVSVKLEGWKELDQALSEMPDKLARNAMRSATRAGANVVYKAIRQRAPVGPGHFDHGNGKKPVKHIRDVFRIGTRFKGLTASATISPGKAAFLLNWLERTGAKPHREPKRGRGNLRLLGGAMVSSVQHPGMKPRPFVVPAFESSWKDALEAMKQKLRENILRIKART